MCCTLPLALVDLAHHEDDDAPADIFAIGFEEIVDLNASNIMAARFVDLSAFNENVPSCYFILAFGLLVPPIRTNGIKKYVNVLRCGASATFPSHPFNSSAFACFSSSGRI